MPRETILIVDDSQEIISFLRQHCLQPLNYNVLAAFNGRVGLDMAVHHHPDLIMLDLSMPHMTGMEMLHALRKTDVDAPVIFMTMFGSENIAVEAFRLGVRDYLAKPFLVEEVQTAVERALGELRLKRERETLQRDLVASETIRQTVVTLSHYINNDLFVISGGLSLLEHAHESDDLDLSLIASPGDEERITRIIADCQNSTRRINAVLRVLQRVTQPKPASYHGEVSMLEIEQALKDELNTGESNL